MKTLVLRSSLSSRLFHWLGALGLLTGAVLLYLFSFWLPYRGATMTGCPTVCEYKTDCQVPKCGSPRVAATCDPETRTCTMDSGHAGFFSASTIFLFLFVGLGWLGIAMYKQKLRLEIDDNGVRNRRWLRDDMEIPWDTFLGITYHGVTTRLGREATVYSITGDSGICSYLVMGLPPNTSTREIEMGAFLLLNATEAEHQQTLALIKEHTNQDPEPEREW